MKPPRFAIVNVDARRGNFSTFDPELLAGGHRGSTGETFASGNSAQRQGLESAVGTAPNSSRAQQIRSGVARCKGEFATNLGLCAEVRQQQDTGSQGSFGCSETQGPAATASNSRPTW